MKEHSLSGKRTRIKLWLYISFCLRNDYMGEDFLTDFKKEDLSARFWF